MCQLRAGSACTQLELAVQTPAQSTGYSLGHGSSIRMSAPHKQAHSPAAKTLGVSSFPPLLQHCMGNA